MPCDDIKEALAVDAEARRIGAVVERSRIRRELLDELGAKRMIVNRDGKKNTLIFYLDRIIPEED